MAASPSPDAGITYLIGHPRQHRCLTVAAQRGPKQGIGKFVRLEIARIEPSASGFDA